MRDASVIEFNDVIMNIRKEEGVLCVVTIMSFEVRKHL